MLTNMTMHDHKTDTFVQTINSDSLVGCSFSRHNACQLQKMHSSLLLLVKVNY